MNLEVLVPSAWTCWFILLGVTLVWTVKIARENNPTPEVGPEFRYLVIALFYAIVLGAGGILYYFTQSRSTGGVLTMVIVFAYVLILFIVQPSVMAYQKWRFERDQARVGRFREPTLSRLADAIRRDDAATLTRLLGGKPAPPGRDRAGYDLLGYALVVLRERNGPLDCVRALLEAGEDPRSPRMPDGQAPIHFMLADITPSGREAVGLLLKYGADPNAVNPTTGNTPIRDSGDSPDLVRALVEAGADVERIQSSGVTALVEFVGEWKWESACYLVEQGARLDVTNEAGLSLAYYLESWKDSVFGDHPEGWDRLRAAIAAREENRPGPA